MKTDRHENCDGAPDGGHSAECGADESPDQEAIDSMLEAKAELVPKVKDEITVLICSCGGELGESLVGDESALRCSSCGRFWPIVEDWMRHREVA